MKIQVLQEDCDSQDFCDSKRCMLARALHRATGDSFSVGTFDVMSFKYLKVYILPKVASRARYDYDHHKKVEPFEFELEGYEL